MLGIFGRQFDSREDPVIEGGGQQLFALLLHLSQERSCGALKNALHAPLRRAATSALAGDPHQDAVTIPGMVELVVTDVDVLTTVIAYGEAEPFATAAQSGINQVAFQGSGEATLV